MRTGGSLAGIVLLASCMLAGHTSAGMPGAYEKATVTDKQVVAAANFAIKEQGKVGEEGAKLELTKILGAESQVVAGMNYRLKLRVNVNGKERTAVVIVWWQAWRKPDPYKLTSWEWSNEVEQEAREEGGVRDQRRI